MAAYVISEVEVLDEEIAASYRVLAQASIEAFGGRYLVRGAEAEVVEGSPSRRRIVIIEFPTMAAARAW